MVFVAVEDLDGFGELGDLVRVAADLVEHTPALELGEHALAGAAEAGVEAVVLRLPLGFVAALDRRGRQVVVKPVTDLVAGGELAVLAQRARDLPDPGGGVVDRAADGS